MKKFLFILFFFSFLLVGCSNSNLSSYSIDEYIASEISEIENIEKYNEETIKTISVIYRTNFNEDKKETLNIIKNQKITDIVKETSGQIINKKISINCNNEYWKKQINKSDLLDYLNKNDISINTLKDIEIISNNNFCEKIIISSKEIDFIKFAQHFNLSSNKDIEIINNDTYLEVVGYGNSFNYDIDILEINNLTEKGLNYKQILEAIS